MNKKITILTVLAAFTILTFNQASAQFTDYNESDPGVTIPPWIKNTAGWWAEDKITETEFLRAIEYLIQNKIMQIKVTHIAEIPDITATYNLPESRQAEFTQITGSFEKKHEGPLTLTIVQPDTSEQIVTTISRDGTFSATIELTSESQIGTYVVYAEIEGELILVNAFEVQDRGANKVPLWIKNNAQWWSEDKITDSDFVTGIEYLVSNKIIIVPTQSPPTPTAPGLTQDDCAGNARCFSGQVTQIVDGNTIRVNEQSIRFALSSAPELEQRNGEEAREFIGDLCPVGSVALVDEDDGQTKGSQGRIIAVIVCNGKNLNAELLDANFGHIPSELCPKSEFASSFWAQKHGCPGDLVFEEQNCDESYPDVCIPPPPPDLECKDIPYRNFAVEQPDPHGFDSNYDGVGCEG